MTATSPAGAQAPGIDAETPADLHEPPVRLPSLPSPPAAAAFPVIAVIAPIGIGLALFAVIGSPHLLLFIAFGPIIAIAHLIDRRVGGRRRHRRATAEFERAATAAGAEIDAALARLCRRRREAHPFARDLVGGAQPIEPGIVVGTTALPSGLRVEGGGHPALEALRRRAARLDEAPFAIEAERIRVLGPRAVVAGATRALVVQLTAVDHGAPFALRGDPGAAIAAELLAAGVDVDSGAARWIDTGEGAGAADVVLRLEEDGSGVARLADGRTVRMRADALGAGELQRWAPGLVAARHRRRREERRLPDRCALADLPVPSAEPRHRSLPAVFAIGADGPLQLDLVADGPHAAIAGTTGSGKSELLVAWAAALAAARTSEECRFLCLDFKGGATFDALAALPHCAGVVTDLDDGEARRVLAGLRAEVRRRESRLRELGARDLADAPGEGRLVVLVDEFQALVQEHPELYEAFADLAARGRSLGIHLVLCTQRPTGVLRESLLANCAIRISLRVEQESCSRTLLGAGNAARLPVDRRGRALVRLGDEPFPVQIALADAATVAAVAAREEQRLRDAAAPEPPPPWLPPHPTRLGLAPPHWALGDEPEQQRQPRIPLAAAGDHLWVTGAQRTGKSTALRAIAAAARAEGHRVVVLGPEVERSWDLVEALAAEPVAAEATPTLLVIDDLDALEQLYEPEHRAVLLERLQRLARSGGRRRLTLVASSRRIAGGLQRLHAVCRSTLRLGAASRQEWLLQGGESGHWVENAPPGRGRLNGMLVQVALPASGEPAVAAPRSSAFRLPDAGLAAAARPAPGLADHRGRLGGAPQGVPPPQLLRDGLEALLATGPVLVGDLDQWQAAYGALPRIAETLPVLVIGASAGEWRALFRGDPPPPALADPWASGWLRHPDGRVERVELAEGAPVRLRAPAAIEPIGAAPAVAVRQAAGAKALGTPEPSAT